MSLLQLLGGRAVPLAQMRRGRDGVRGLFARRRCRKGEMLLRIPLRNCYFPHASYDPRVLRRWNRCTLLPEFPAWLRHLSPDSPEDRVSLSMSVSTDRNDVVSLSLSPVEAALAVSVALRYFWRDVVKVKNRDAAVGPLRDRKAELYIKSLPLAEYISYGLEAPYFSGTGCDASVHSIIEQICWNLRDCILSHATQQEYSVYDSYPSELDNAILASVYVVRARAIKMRVVRGEDRNADTVTSAIVPVVDMLNHSAASATCVACVSLPVAAVVVRAVRDIDVSDELTLDYSMYQNQRMFPHGKRESLKTRGSFCLDDEEEGDLWESRYLFSRDFADTGGLDFD